MNLIQINDKTPFSMRDESSFYLGIMAVLFSYLIVKLIILSLSEI